MIDFPSSPIDGQQYTYDKRSWEWSEAKNAWLLVPVSTADADYAAIKAAEANLSAVAAKASEDIAETAAAESLASELAAAASASSAAGAINTAKTTLELNTQTGTTYTLDLADAGMRVSMSNAAANELTVPPNSAAAFPLNTIIYVSQDGAGATSIAAGAGVTINTAEGLKVGGQYKMVSLIKTATDTWLGIGSVA